MEPLTVKYVRGKRRAPDTLIPTTDSNKRSFKGPPLLKNMDQHTKRISCAIASRTGTTLAEHMDVSGKMQRHAGANAMFAEVEHGNEPSHLSPFERLPIEIMETIFEFSQNPNLKLVSPHVDYMLSHPRILAQYSVSRLGPVWLRLIKESRIMSSDESDNAQNLSEEVKSLISYPWFTNDVASRALEKFMKSLPHFSDLWNEKHPFPANANIDCVHRHIGNFHTGRMRFFSYELRSIGSYVADLSLRNLVYLTEPEYKELQVGIAYDHPSVSFIDRTFGSENLGALVSCLGPLNRVPWDTVKLWAISLYNDRKFGVRHRNEHVHDLVVSVMESRYGTFGAFYGADRNAHMWNFDNPIAYFKNIWQHYDPETADADIKHFFASVASWDNSFLPLLFAKQIIRVVPLHLIRGPWSRRPPGADHEQIHSIPCSCENGPHFKIKTNLAQEEDIMRLRTLSFLAAMFSREPFCDSSRSQLNPEAHVAADSTILDEVHEILNVLILDYLVKCHNDYQQREKALLPHIVLRPEAVPPIDVVVMVVDILRFQCSPDVVGVRSSWVASAIATYDFNRLRLLIAPIKEWLGHEINRRRYVHGEDDVEYWQLPESIALVDSYAGLAIVLDGVEFCVTERKRLLYCMDYSG